MGIPILIAVLRRVAWETVSNAFLTPRKVTHRGLRSSHLSQKEDIVG